MHFKIPAFLGVAMLFSCSSENKTTSEKPVRLITLDPGHFHAALIQKQSYPDIDTNVFVYTPDGDDVIEHLKRIEGYNKRNENPTNWNEQVYKGSDFLQKMLDEKKGNVVVIAGNNQRKAEYIKASIQAGLNVLSDKPMSINRTDFELIRESFELASQKGVLLYDIMTERSEINTILQKALSMDTLLFGTLQQGSTDNPAVTKESVHYFYKYVSGSALKRPAWFFDVKQQGEGIVDVTTHLIDLIQWECFPEQALNYENDIEIIKSERWATAITPSQFREVTSLDVLPDYLKKDLKDSMLNVFANGEIRYKIRGVNARVSVQWNYKAPEGAGDTHFSIMRGTKADLIIKQGLEQNFKPVLYILPATANPGDENLVKNAVNRLTASYPGLETRQNGSMYEVIVPEKYKTSHEEHFAQVTERFLQYLKNGKLPDWEVPNILAKYYTTAKALELATGQK
jgi:predicted dehydrogenase